MKRSQDIAALIAGLALLAATGGALADDGRSVSIRLKSFQEVPAVSSAASGRFKAQLDEQASAIRYELSYSGLEGEVRQAHIHIGQRGVNGGIMVFLCQTTANPDPTMLAPTCPQSGTVSGVLQAANVIAVAPQGVDAMGFAEMLKAIAAGVAYVNVHSTRFPGGELRGQLREDE